MSTYPRPTEDDAIYLALESLKVASLSSDRYMNFIPGYLGLLWQEMCRARSSPPTSNRKTLGDRLFRGFNRAESPCQSLVAKSSPASAFQSICSEIEAHIAWLANDLREVVKIFSELNSYRIPAPNDGKFNDIHARMYNLLERNSWARIQRFNNDAATRWILNEPVEALCSDLQCGKKDGFTKAKLNELRGSARAAERAVTGVAYILRLAREKDKAKIEETSTGLDADEYRIRI
ncbi:hypothetical protein BDV95DRAFT_249364 [Massariosphaeria phaeospora]|uniref:Uncharacterized protein n=1 Tax=Massariosphaeria phaeospora TaxID=100035 RepID=A0A7C8M2A9_9PLEO|nr:hypothetical protein BDV95DRAFT_249364 [Massariosphaeria phaeospora]